MNILIIGSGGREHSIANSLKKSQTCDKLFCSPGNPGISSIAECITLAIDNSEEIISFCKNNGVSLVVIGPEQPLADGLSDDLRSSGILVFGPSKAAAQLETSKSFAKNFMQKYNIPTSKFATFDKSQLNQAKEYVEKSTHTPIVLKADGLAAGKGVTIAETKELALITIENYFNGEFGTASEKIVIEEFMQGFEASVFAICDGSDFIVLAPAQDHKRIGDGDTGKNTGGMGAYAPAPLVTEKILDQIKIEIISPTLKGMIKEDMPFVGCLYVGLMITNKSTPKVVEYNVRFGDPETQAVLSIFDGDFAELLYSAAIGELDKSTVKNVSSKSACCVVLASSGYPEKFETGFEIKDNFCSSTQMEIEKNNSIIFHSGTKLINKKLVTSGGRVLGVTAFGDTLQEAIENTYKRVSAIEFENKYYRIDIGQNAFLEKP